MANDESLKQDIKKYFPTVITNNIVDRVALGKIIFEDQKKR